MVVFGRKRIIVKPQNGCSITCKMNWVLRGIGRRDVGIPVSVRQILVFKRE